MKKSQAEKNTSKLIQNGEYGELEFVSIDDETMAGNSTDDEALKVENDEKATEDSSEDEEIVEENYLAGEGISSQIINICRYWGIIAISLVYWELIMATQLGKWTPSGLFFLCFIPAQALMLTTFTGIGNKLSSKITLPIVLIVPGIYYLAQMVYIKTFGSLLSISMAGMGEDAIGNFGWAAVDSVKGAVLQIALLFLPILLSILLSIFDWIKIDSYKVVYRIGTLLGAVVLWLFAMLFIRCFGNDRLSPYYMLTSRSAVTDTSAKKIGTLTTGIAEAASYYLGVDVQATDEFAIEDDEEFESIVVEENDSVEEVEETEEDLKTPWMNEAIDFDKIANDTDDSKLKSLAGYFATRKPSTTNEYTGMFEGYNLIYICAESFWSYACNEEVTPTLYKMAHNGIVLNNYYNSFYNTTTNGEFAFSTSLWPDVSRNSKNGTNIGSFAQSSTKYMPQGLGDLFTAKGINSYAFHNYYGKYYRRILSWPNLGYTCRFTGDRGMYFSSNWPASDYELMLQTVDDYINDDQFHAYYMTFSGHGPFTSKNYMYNKNMPTVNSILGTEKYTDMARGYLAGELELEMAMKYLLERLEQAGKLDKTVIVLTSDHYPYYLEDEARDSLAGHVMDSDFEIYHSTCMIYNAGMSEPIEINNYCSNIDIAPTICNLFNIPFESRLMIGRDIFSDEAHNRAVLYNMSFIDDYVKYNFETGEAVWTEKGNSLSDEQKRKYIDRQLNSIENEYTASCRAIDENFFFDVYIASGLLSSEEIAQEKERASIAQNQDDTFNAEDEAEKAEKEAKKLLQQQIDAGLVTLDENGNPVMVMADPNAMQAIDPVTGLPVVAPAAGDGITDGAIDPATGLVINAVPAVQATDPAKAAPVVEPATAPATDPAATVPAIDPAVANPAPVTDAATANPIVETEPATGVVDAGAQNSIVQ